MTTRDEILAMAREAGFPAVTGYGIECMERFFRLAQAAAYELAANVCETRSSAEQLRGEGCLSGDEIEAIIGANEICADAIRAIKEKA